MTEYVTEILDFINNNLSEDAKLSFGVGKWTILYKGIPLDNVELTDIAPFKELKSSIPFFDIYKSNDKLIILSNSYTYYKYHLLNILTLKDS